jgi:geranylgeranyl pyrophosphate synthase
MSEITSKLKKHVSSTLPKIVLRNHSKKTATLIAARCALGAKSVIEDELQVEKMQLENLSDGFSNQDVI